MTDWIEFFNKIENKEAIGEIVESYHDKFVFQTYDCFKVPEYSSIVVALAGEELAMGVVTSISITPVTGIIETPKLFNRKRNELFMQYRDLMDKFTAKCEAITIAYYKGGKFKHTRPTKVPLIHDLVFLPKEDFLKEMHKEEGKLSLRYIPIIYSSMSRDERFQFGFFLEDFFDSLSKVFTSEEIYSMLDSINQSIAENNLEEIINLVSTAIPRSLKKKK